MGRSYITRYCGSVNKVSTEFCSLARNSLVLSLVVGRSSFIELQGKERRGCGIWLTTNDKRPTTGSTLRLMSRSARRDPVELEIFKNLYHSIAEEMGAALRRTAFSPNIKERRDYSCA